VESDERVVGASIRKVLVKGYISQVFCWFLTAWEISSGKFSESLFM